MPNWCFNYLNIKGKNVDIMEFIQDHNIDNLNYENYENFKFETIEPYPNDTWDYEWCYENWGTKWNPITTSIEISKHDIIINMDTAWSPPIKWLEKASIKYPSLEFSMDSIECSGDFRGNYIIQNGNYSLFLEGSYVDYLMDTLSLKKNMSLIIREIININILYKTDIKKALNITSIVINRMDMILHPHEYLQHGLRDYIEVEYEIDESLWLCVEQMFMHITNCMFVQGENIEVEAVKDYMMYKVSKYINNMINKCHYIMKHYKSYKLRKTVKIISKKAILHRELVHFALQPPSNTPLLKNGGYLYQESMKNFSCIM